MKLLEGNLALLESESKLKSQLLTEVETPTNTKLKEAHDAMTRLTILSQRNMDLEDQVSKLIVERDHCNIKL